MSTYTTLLGMCQKQNVQYQREWARDPYQKGYVAELRITSNVAPFYTLVVYFGPSGRSTGGLWFDDKHTVHVKLSGGMPVFVKRLRTLLDISKVSV